MIKKKTSAYRKLSMYGFDLVNGSHNFHALLEFDITDLRKRLRQERRAGRGGSLFAFLLKAIGKCLELHPELNSMIDYRNTTTFEDVDISIPIELTDGGHIRNRQYVIRNINAKSVGEIADEIDGAKRQVDGQAEYGLPGPALAVIARLPKRFVLWGLRMVMRDHQRIKALSGTIFVTSVSMFSNVPGYVIPYIGGPKAVSVAIGSTLHKPMVVDGAIAIREMINVTAVFNHDLVDGAPAARFINRLRKYIEREPAALL
jgi:pyruvate/2-oxoglutarate dehydrogenase complex dihydrolipoamide acyltransferase (E2) component